MRKAGWLVIGALVCACSDDDDDIFIDDFDDIDADGIPDDIDDDLPDNVSVWRATIAGIGNFSQLTGDSVVRQIDNGTPFSATTTIRGDVTNAVRPWHVHFGTCATGGEIVGDGLASPRLTVGSDGTATASVRISCDLDEDDAYHINIHESDAAFDNIIACGDLVLQ